MGGQLGFGIAGCGMIASFHADAIGMLENARIAAVCDMDAERAAAFARRYGAQKVYTDYRAMNEDGDVDIVCVCTPSGLHGELVENAAKNRKHILCEKPIETTKAKLDGMIAAVRQNGVKMGCVFQRRFFPDAIAVKRAINAGAIGRILMADAYMKFYRDPSYYKQSGWKGTWAMDGGGAMMNQGVHGIDLLQWLTGGVQSVSGFTGTLARPIETEDAAVAVCRHACGALGVIECSTCVTPAQELRIELHGEKGSVTIGGGGIALWDLQGCSRPEGLPRQESRTKDDPTAVEKLGHLPMVRDLVDAIREDREPLIPPEEGRKAVDIILAVYESAKTGKEVLLNDIK